MAKSDAVLPGRDGGKLRLPGGGAQAVNQIAFLIFGALLVIFLVGVLVSIRISIRIVSRKQY